MGKSFDSDYLDIESSIYVDLISVKIKIFELLQIVL